MIESVPSVFVKLAQDLVTILFQVSLLFHSLQISFERLLVILSFFWARIRSDSLYLAVTCSSNAIIWPFSSPGLWISSLNFTQTILLKNGRDVWIAGMLSEWFSWHCYLLKLFFSIRVMMFHVVSPWQRVCLQLPVVVPHFFQLILCKDCLAHHHSPPNHHPILPTPRENSFPHHLSLVLATPHTPPYFLAPCFSSSPRHGLLALFSVWWLPVSLCQFLRPQVCRLLISRVVCLNPLLSSPFLFPLRRGCSLLPSAFPLLSSTWALFLSASLNFSWKFYLLHVGNSGRSSIGFPDLSSHLVSGRLSYVSLSMKEKPALISGLPASLCSCLS